jgi:hypothetical protein
MRSEAGNSIPPSIEPMKIPHAIAILGFSLLANTLQAKPRLCRIVFPERPQDAPKSAYLFDGSKSHVATLPSMNLSEVIELPDGEITLAMTTNEISDPKVLSPNAPLVRIPEKVMDFYIIITPDPQNQELPIKMNLVDTGGGKLKPGETLWYNFTGHRIVAKLGSAGMSVDPMGRTISKDPVPTSDYYIARFAYQVDGKGALAPITEQSWWHDATSRHLGFMVNSGGKLPKIYFYRDYRLPESTKEGPTE